MGRLSAEDYARRVFDQHLLNETQLNQVWAEFGTRDISGDKFRQLLLRRELVTNFQIEKIERNHRSGYFYGENKVLYIVGAGTFARVYRAVHRRKGQIVAVKVLRARHSKEKELTDQFLREGEVGVTLRHPNIVPIYEVCSEKSNHYFVMEFLEGRDLREFMKVRKKLNPQQATDIAVDIAAGLDYACSKGISHRDLKMSNVLISARGVAKLVDFGLAGLDATVSEDNVEDIVNPRTIDYAGLERGTGVRRGDPRSDIYFLGSIYYRLLTGKSPLVETRDRTQRLSKTRFEQVMPINEVDESIPRAVAALVSKAMQLDPELRYQTPGQLLDQLNHVAERLRAGSSLHQAPRVAAVRKKTVMIVEPNVDVQNIFRERFKKCGYRVLVISDPERALSRLNDGPGTADCVIFNTERLERTALDAFNELGESTWTCNTPAVLLLAAQHKQWSDEAKLSDRRVVLPMPIKMGRLQKALEKLLKVRAKH